MSAVDPKILDKIKKCLALGASPNPNEAAVAMRQAHALMKKHGIEAHQVAMAEIGESTTEIRTMSRDKPARWETHLAAVVGKAFGCKLMIGRTLVKSGLRRHLNEGQFIFIGQKAQAEVAAYTLDVLARKCKTARKTWISENLAGLSGRGMKAKATRMGDAFAEGWVLAIGRLVADFANPPEIEQAIEKHAASMSSGGGEAPVRGMKDGDIGAAEMLAAAMGNRAAKWESLYRPMSTDGASQLAIGMEGGAA